MAKGPAKKKSLASDANITRIATINLHKRLHGV
jgi:hypothetical protein